MKYYYKLMYTNKSGVLRREYFETPAKALQFRSLLEYRIPMANYRNIRLVKTMPEVENAETYLLWFDVEFPNYNLK